MPRQNMNEATMCITAGGALVAVLTAYFGLGSFLFSVPARHGAVCERWGYVFNNTYPPGLHLKDPFTFCYNLRTDEQVDSVTNLQCDTNDAATLIWPRVDVHNKLPFKHVLSVYKEYGKDYDVILINKLISKIMIKICANTTVEKLYLWDFNDVDESLTDELQLYNDEKESGLEILMALFQGKPQEKGEGKIIASFKKRAETKAKKEALKEEEATIQQETKNQQLVIDGENEVKAANAEAEQRVITAALTAELLRKQQAAESARLEGQINNLKELEKAENEAKIKVETAKSELEARKLKAKGNKELLTPEYRDHARTGAITNNAKIYFGDAIRDVFPVMSAWTKP